MSGLLGTEIIIENIVCKHFFVVCCQPKFSLHHDCQVIVIIIAAPPAPFMYSAKARQPSHAMQTVANLRSISSSTFLLSSRSSSPLLSSSSSSFSTSSSWSSHLEKRRIKKWVWRDVKKREIDYSLWKKWEWLQVMKKWEWWNLLPLSSPSWNLHIQGNLSFATPWWSGSRKRMVL